VVAQHAAPEWHVPSVSLAVAFISLAIWLYLAFARGAFWRLREFDDDFGGLRREK